MPQGRCAVHIVLGPAGSGKSTYCASIQQYVSAAIQGGRGRGGDHGGGGRRANMRRVHVVNLDPAAEDDVMSYDPIFDVRDIVNVQEVMEELNLGPNGALLYCMEYIFENMDDYIRDVLDEYDEEDCILLDCPGQMELYTHVPVMKNMLDRMKMWGYDSCMVCTYCVDVTFITDASKFLSATLLSLSTQIALEIPHVSVLTKCDLIDDQESIERILSFSSASQLWDVDQDQHSLLHRAILPQQQSQQLPSRYDLTYRQPRQRAGQQLGRRGGQQQKDGNHDDQDDNDDIELRRHLRSLEHRRKRRHRLTDAICSILDDYSMVGFVPLNITDEESIDHVLLIVNHAIHHDEDLEVRGADGDDTDFQQFNDTLDDDDDDDNGNNDNDE